MATRPVSAGFSSGILLHRVERGALRVLLVHPGGPFWRNKDAGAWQIPKGGVAPGEEPLAAALREFEEELGSPPPAGPAVSLGEVRQRGGKWVHVFAIRGDFDPDALVSNFCAVEWPRGSGRMIDIPEVDRAHWFALDEARAMILPSQAPFLDRLRASIGNAR